MLTDIEIAQGAQMKHIRNIAEAAGICEEYLEYYGKYKAKISSELWDKVRNSDNGKLVLVTAINHKNGQKMYSCASRTVAWSRYGCKGRRGRRRLQPGCAHGGHKFALYRRYACYNRGE